MTRPGIAVLLALALTAGLGAAGTRTAPQPGIPAASPGIPAASPGLAGQEVPSGAVRSGEDAPGGQGRVGPGAPKDTPPGKPIRPSPETTPPPGAAPVAVARFVPPRRFSLTVPVLTYHRVEPGWTTLDEYIVSPGLFSEHLGALVSRGWRAVTAHDLGILLATRGTPPDHTFVITIDDGWQDGITQALPILQRYGLVATFYVVPGLIGTERYLTWEQVRALRDAGMEIGNHTMNHTRMTQMTAAEAARAVHAAQDVLTRQLGDEPDTFAYPFGAFNATAVEAVRGAAMLLALTTRSGTVSTWDDRLTVARIHVGPGTTSGALLRAMGGLAGR